LRKLQTLRKLPNLFEADSGGRGSERKRKRERGERRNGTAYFGDTASRFYRKEYHEEQHDV